MHNSTPPTAPLHTLDDLARILNIGRRKAWELAVTGAVPGFKLGREWRFRPDDVAAWLDLQVVQRGEARGGVR